MEAKAWRAWRWGALVVIFAFVVGMRLGGSLERQQVSGKSTPEAVGAGGPAVASTRTLQPASPPASGARALRCYQAVRFDGKNQPHLTQRAWTQAEIEAEVHLAQMARDTAMANVWNATAERWLRIGELTMLIVRECRRTP